MHGRLADRKAIIVGAGQMPGETIGNGRAIAMLFAREGAEVLCVDCDHERVRETVAIIVAEGGTAFDYAADITRASECAALVKAGEDILGGVDILVNNVGIGIGGPSGDGPAHLSNEHAFSRILDVNLKGMWLTIKAVIPLMREAGTGAIVNISSGASLIGCNQIGYEVSKAAVNRLTLSVAAENAKYGLRCNAVLPGLMDTPMAVTGIALATGQTEDVVRQARNARVPLGGKMGTGWDTAYAALFLACDEARFITGALVPVDGGRSIANG